METTFNEFIIQELEKYDNHNTIQFIEYLNASNVKIESTLITFIINENSKIFNYELLSRFDTTTNIWTWSWVFTNINKIKLVKRLLDYGFTIELSDNNKSDVNFKLYLYLKSIIINSHIIITTYEELEFIIVAIRYLMKDNILFIYSNNDKNIINYYIIYND